MALLMGGNGLTSSLLGIRAGLEGFTPAVTGLVLSGYYGGFLLGSFAGPDLIRRVGHIRAFAGLASLASAAVLIHVVRPDPLTWLTLRAISGLCISGLFVVTETWMNGTATNATRGRLLSAYMVVVTGGMAVGQLLLTMTSPGGFGAFVLASVLVSLAVVPVSLTAISAPDVPEPTPLSLRETAATAPLALAGAAAAGFIGAAVVGTGAVYAAEAGLGTGKTGLLLAAVLAFALAAQLPLGRASDRTDRRRVILGLSVAGAALALAAAVVGPSPFFLLLPCAAAAGGLSFPLYSLSSAHLNDYLSSDTVAAAGARMVFVNGAGAVAGPLVAAAVIDVIGVNAFFVTVAICYALVAVYTAVRLTRRLAVPAEDRAAFVPYALGTAPTVATLAPEASTELYPADAGELDAGGVRLRWEERGSGAPVVLVHDAGSSTESWNRVAANLASTGHRVLAWDLRGHGESGPGPGYDVEDHVADLSALLTDRGVARAAFVGHGAGAGIVTAFGTAHPERVDAAALVCAGESLGRPPRRPGRAKPAGPPSARTVVPDPPPSSPAAGGLFRRRPPEHRRVLAADRQRARPEAVIGTRRSVRRAPSPAALDASPVPVLAVRGEGQRPVTGATDEVVLARTGHFVQLEQPDALSDALVEFIRRDRSSDPDHDARERATA